MKHTQARIVAAPALLDSSLADIPDGFAPLWLHHHRLGAISPAWLPRLDPTLFDIRDMGSHVQVHLVTTRRHTPGPAPLPSLDERLQAWAGQLHARGQMPGWRGEQVEIFGPDPSAPLFCIERGLLRPLGLLLRTVQLNVHTWAAGRLMVWAARRAPHKAVDPNLLDSLVAGGIARGETPLDALLREAAEEAALPVRLSRQAVPSAIMDSSSLDHEDGAPVLHRERMHVFDVQVPPDYVPSHPDGESSGSALLSPEQVLALVRIGHWTREGAWASVNLVHRYHTGSLRPRRPPHATTPRKA